LGLDKKKLIMDGYSAVSEEWVPCCNSINQIDMPGKLTNFTF